MTCKGCGENKKLIDAHIIPKSFYMDLRASDNHLDIIPSNPTDRKGRSFKGDYDTSILCAECDKVMEIYDDYGKKLLLDQSSDFKELIHEGKIYGWEIEEYDYLKLKLFLLSVLWRASITQRKFFKDVNLGSIENHLKELIWQGKDDPINFSCVLARFRPYDETSLEKMILDPDNKEIDGINCYRFYLGGYIVWIKVDAAITNDGIFKLQLRENQSAVVVARDFGSSKELALVKKSVAQLAAKRT